MVISGKGVQGYKILGNTMGPSSVRDFFMLGCSLVQRRTNNMGNQLGLNDTLEVPSRHAQIGASEQMHHRICMMV